MTRDSRRLILILAGVAIVGWGIAFALGSIEHISVLGDGSGLDAKVFVNGKAAGRMSWKRSTETPHGVELIAGDIHGESMDDTILRKGDSLTTSRDHVVLYGKYRIALVSPAGETLATRVPAGSIVRVYVSFRRRVIVAIAGN